MARPLLPSETQALATAEILLRYAAENKELPRDLVATTCSALDAQQAGTWNEALATEFWCAFNKLCELVRPATVDSLMTTVAAATRSPWWGWAGRFGRPTAASLSQRTAKRYLCLLIFLLAVSVVLGFIVSTTKGLGKEIEALAEQGNALTTKMRAETVRLEAERGSASFDKESVKQRLDREAIQADLKQQRFVMVQLLQKQLMMTRLMIFGLGDSIEIGRFRPAQSYADLLREIDNYEDVRIYAAGDLLQTQVSISVITSTVLPIVLGLMGACAYVIRLISDQIKDTTFSKTSPIRHLVRVALGGLAGVVIGFGGVVTDFGMSSTALAFIAGYAIEPVFSMLDSIAEKFRR